jgi:hypothetical protein
MKSESIILDDPMVRRAKQVKTYMDQRNLSEDTHSNKSWRRWYKNVK